MKLRLLRYWLNKIDARPARERLLVIGGILALTWLVADQAFITPAWRHYKLAHQQALLAGQSEVQMRQTQMERDRQGLEEMRIQEQQLNDLRARVRQSERLLAQRGASLVPAKEMVQVLRDVLKQNARLHLHSLQNLAGNELSGNAVGGHPLYRHGVQLTVEGSYADLRTYCRELESLPQHLLWGSLALSAADYPKISMTLQLYTLSQDPQWLEL